MCSDVKRDHLVYLTSLSVNSGLWRDKVKKNIIAHFCPTVEDLMQAYERFGIDHYIPT